MRSEPDMYVEGAEFDEGVGGGAALSDAAEQSGGKCFAVLVPNPRVRGVKKLGG